jgi:hypothetical protein
VLVKSPCNLDSAYERFNLPKYSSRAFARVCLTRALEPGTDAQDAQVIVPRQGHRYGGPLILKPNDEDGETREAFSGNHRFAGRVQPGKQSDSSLH